MSGGTLTSAPEHGHTRLPLSALWAERFSPTNTGGPFPVSPPSTFPCGRQFSASHRNIVRATPSTGGSFPRLPLHKFSRDWFSARVETPPQPEVPSPSRVRYFGTPPSVFYSEYAKLPDSAPEVLRSRQPSGEQSGLRVAAPLCHFGLPEPPPPPPNPLRTSPRLPSTRELTVF